MKIELLNNKIFINDGKNIQEIHPFWLRERIDGKEYLDAGTEQRLFDIDQNICGTVDLILLNKKTNNYAIFDYKTSKNLGLCFDKYKEQIKIYGDMFIKLTSLDTFEGVVVLLKPDGDYELHTTT